MDDEYSIYENLMKYCEDKGVTYIRKICKKLTNDEYRIIFKEDIDNDTKCTQK